MCYYLYGGINQNVDHRDLERLKSGSPFCFTACSEEEFKNAIQGCSRQYRLTKYLCDCKTAVGSHKTEKKELADLADRILKLSKARYAKHIFLLKRWTDDPVEMEPTVHIEDLDLLSFLADVQENRLYKLQLFKRYFKNDATFAPSISTENL